ncbi:hypothetical protein D777_00876 [Marinobacter nitratireducens]|uniref:SxtJ n=1 Tax=Marinobacter nitratireducens TaxID=1137280 RepID=A0A072N4Q9_9GAMM|nr:hypothetical protein D777_00876 [Marinobacter nitratireducens]
MDVRKEREEARTFGYTLAIFLGVVFGLLLPWWAEYSLPVWPWVLGAGLGVIAFLHPTALSPLRRGFIRVGEPLGRFNSVFLLSLVYFVLICPMGFLMRLLGKDPIHRSFDSRVSSYRKQSESSTSLELPF